MPTAHAFHDGLEYEDPKGTVGRIYFRRTFFTIKFWLRFPGREPVVIFTNWKGQVTGSVGGQTLTLRWEDYDTEKMERHFLAYSHEGLSLKNGHAQTYRGREITITREGSRISLSQKSGVVWTWRLAWKDAEIAAGVKGLVFVPDPESLGEELDWWLFLALNVHASPWPLDPQ